MGEFPPFPQFAISYFNMRMFALYLVCLLCLTSGFPFLETSFRKQYKNSHKLSRHSNNLRSAGKYVMAGDIKYCGSYETMCEDLDLSSIYDSLTFNGMMHKQPVYVNSTFHAYLRFGCQQENKFRGETVTGMLQKQAGSDNKYDFTVDQITFVPYHKNACAHFTCEEEMTLGKEFDIMKVHCKDCDGEDPFRYDKELIGKTYEVEYSFYDDRVTTIEDGAEVKLERKSDEGCRC